MEGFKGRSLFTSSKPAYGKASLDLFWRRNEGLEESDNLPDTDVIATRAADTAMDRVESRRPPSRPRTIPRITAEFDERNINPKET
jgi:hypothetical protein